MKACGKRLSAAAVALVCSVSTIGIHAPSVSAKTRTVQVQINDHGFTPSQILAVIHQPVHLHITNTGKEVHEFAIPEYRIYTRDLGPGETSDVQFSPWQAGTFTMYSDPEADEHPEFSGRFIVVDQK